MDQSTSWNLILKQFHESCSNFDHVWMKRRRLFDTFSLTSSLIDLVAGSDPSYASVMHRFKSDDFRIPSASSFCEARSKFPSYILSEINKDIYNFVTDFTEPMDWFGYTPLAMDGSVINIPTKMIGKGYRVKNGLSPTALLTSLVRISDRMAVGLKISDHFDEREHAHEFLEELADDDLVVYDRGYLSFALLNDHLAKGVAAVFRVSSGNIFRELQEFMLSEEVDQIIQIDPTDATYRNAKKVLPDLPMGPLEIRAIKYKIGNVTYLIATTLLDKSIPMHAFVHLYSKRWHIEEFLKSFKMTINAEYFHSLSVNGIEQEIQAAGLLWNLSRALEIVSRPFKKKTQIVQKHHIINAILDKQLST